MNNTLLYLFPRNYELLMREDIKEDFPAPGPPKIIKIKEDSHTSNNLGFKDIPSGLYYFFSKMGLYFFYSG